MSRCRLLLSGALVVGTLAVPTATAVGSASATSAPCDSWRAPVSGLWSEFGQLDRGRARRRGGHPSLHNRAR